MMVDRSTSMSWKLCSNLVPREPTRCCRGRLLPAALAPAMPRAKECKSDTWVDLGEGTAAAALGSLGQIVSLVYGLRPVMQCWEVCNVCNVRLGHRLSQHGTASILSERDLDAPMQSAISCVCASTCWVCDMCASAMVLHRSSTMTHRVHTPASTTQDQDDWLDKVGPHIQARMERYAASEIRFNLMAVIGDRSEALTERLHKQQAEYTGLQGRLAAGPHTGSAPMEVGRIKDCTVCGKVGRSLVMGARPLTDSAVGQELLSHSPTLWSDVHGLDMMYVCCVAQEASIAKMGHIAHSSQATCTACRLMEEITQACAHFRPEAEIRRAGLKCARACRTSTFTVSRLTCFHVGTAHGLCVSVLSSVHG